MTARGRIFAAAMLAAVAMSDGIGVASASMPAPRKGSSGDHKVRRRVQIDPDISAEIKAHNAEVDRRKAEKKAAKAARKAHNVEA